MDRDSIAESRKLWIERYRDIEKLLYYLHLGICVHSGVAR